ncbi:MAG: GntR family transcriptional regulator [Chloroflexota bacterium]
MVIGSELRPLPSDGGAVESVRPGQPDRLGLAELAYSELFDAILAGRLKPGTRLAPEALAAQLGVSAMPVKLALARLSAEGLVTEVVRRGMFVTKLRPDGLDSLFRARLLLETAAAREYGHRATPEIVDRLTELARAHRRWATDADGGPEVTHRWSDADRAFHGTIVQLTENEHVIAWHQRAHIHIQISRGAVPPSRLRETSKQHFEIVDAFRTHNVAEVDRLLRAHIEGAQTYAANMLRQKSDGLVLRPITHVPGGRIPSAHGGADGVGG